jgi:hypothetical protein
VTFFEIVSTGIIEEFDKPFTVLNLRFDLFILVVVWKFLNDFGQGVLRCRLCMRVILIKGVISVYARLIDPPFRRTPAYTSLGRPFYGARRRDRDQSGVMVVMTTDA